MFNKFINLYPFSLLYNCYTYSYGFRRNPMASAGILWRPQEFYGLHRILMDSYGAKGD